MSKVVKPLKKAADKKETVTEQIEPDFQNLEVSDIRKKLFEKIKERQSSSGKSRPVDLAGVSKQIETPEPSQGESVEILAAKLRDEYEAKIKTLDLENKKLTRLQEETLKEIDAIRSKLEEKDRTIADLEKRPAEDPAEIKKDKDKAVANVESLRSKLYAATKESKEQSSRIGQLEETLKAKEKRLAESENKLKKTESQNEETSEKLKSVVDESGKKGDEIERLKSEIEVIEEKLADIQKQRSKDIDIAKKEIALELQASEREKKALEGKIAQLGAELEAKNNRISQAEDSHKELSDALKEASLKSENAESKNKDIEKEISQLRDYSEAKEKKLAQVDKLYKESELAGKELSLHFKAAEREKKALENKVSQLNIELDAKNARIEESERAYKELDGVVKDAGLKLESAEHRVRDSEEKITGLNSSLEEIESARQNDRVAFDEGIAKLKNEIAGLKSLIIEKDNFQQQLIENARSLESDIEERDKKIQNDVKYCEKILKEVNDSRQKIKEYRLRGK